MTIMTEVGVVWGATGDGEVDMVEIRTVRDFMLTADQYHAVQCSHEDYFCL